MDLEPGPGVGSPLDVDAGVWAVMVQLRGWLVPL